MIRKPSRTGLVLFVVCTVSTIISVAGDDTFKKKERAQTHLMEARRLAADYKIEKAADKARDALKDDSNLAEAHVYLGMERLRAQDLKEAQNEFARALDLDPYSALAHCHLGYVLYQQGELDGATDHWTLSTRLDPTSPPALAGLALSQFKHGQQDDAVHTFDRVLTYDRRFADLKFLESEKGPKWSGQLLQDFQSMLGVVTKP
jgi:tetratricopeptide (TPR) repeat protein